MLRRPRARPDGRVVDGVLVHQVVAVHQGQPLDEHQVLAGAQERPADLVVLAVEVRRLDYQRVAVPVAARVAHPLAHLRRDVRPAVQRHDARVVVLLRQQDDVVRRLEHLDVVVVAAGADRRTRLRVLDAAVARVEVLVGAGGKHPPAHRGDPRRLRRLGAHPRVIRQGRQPSVRRVHDERRAPRPDGGRSPIQPEVVVEAGRSVRPPVDLIARGGRLGRAIQEPLVALESLPLQCRRLLLGQEGLVAQLHGPFERCERPVVPRPLEIGMAPGRPEVRRVRGLSCGRHRHQRHARDRRQRRRVKSIPHSPSLLHLAILTRVFRGTRAFTRRPATRRGAG